jgi:hypothetical protein
MLGVIVTLLMGINGNKSKAAKKKKKEWRRGRSVSRGHFLYAIYQIGKRYKFRRGLDYRET